MNEIAKKATAEKLVRTMEVEGLKNKVDMGRKLGIHGNYISMILNEKTWFKCPNHAWEAVLNWLNSGYTLEQYAKKYPPVIKVEKSIDGKKWEEVATVPEGTKNIEIPDCPILPDMDKPAEQVIRESVKTHPLTIEALQSKQEFTDTARLKIALDIEINLVVNGHKVSMV